MNQTTYITMDDAHTFAQGLIANGWLNEDPDCVDTLYRQLVAITALPAGYELAPSIATLEMQVAGQAVGVNAAWSFAKCYRAMLDAQPRKVAPAFTMSPEILQAWLARDICTCPSGDGSLRWPCPTHPPQTLTNKHERAAVDNLADVRDGLRNALNAHAKTKD